MVRRSIRPWLLPVLVSTVEHPDRLDAVAALGVDETAFLAANAKHPTIFVTGMVDVHGRRLLDVVPGRTSKALHDWVSAQPPAWRESISVAPLDPFRGYATALSTSLPGAVRVLDAFHVVQLGFAAVDDVRRRVQQETLGHRGRRDDPLYRIRRVVRRGAEHLIDHAWERLLADLDAGDVDEKIGLGLDRRPGPAPDLPAGHQPRLSPDLAPIPFS